MGKTASFLLKQYKKMPGDKKVKLAMHLSWLAREVNKAGQRDTKVIK